MIKKIFTILFCVLCLSGCTNNTPDKELSVVVDVVIITSPQCECLKNYIKLDFWIS